MADESRNLLVKILEDRLQDIKTACQKMGKGLQGQDSERPLWMFLNADALAALDSDSIHTFFSRQECEEMYEEASAKDGLMHTCAMATNQSDILAGLERDFRMRHRSRVRMLAHEATAKETMGSNGGVIQKGIIEWLQDEAMRQSGDPAAGS